jgi:hypothetical protein
MKTNIQHATATLLIMLGFTLGFTQCSEGETTDSSLAPDQAALKAALPSDALSREEIDAIRFMREEEKLARDVYLYLYQQYPLRPFLNISKSEQAHMDALLYLIHTFGLEDPAGEHPEGVFENQELQKLYNDLIEKGSQSREEALRTGALIEEVDILDLQRELEESARNEEVVRVFQNLCNASGRHLKAFVAVLHRYDVDYSPVKLEPEEFDRIIGR